MNTHSAPLPEFPGAHPIEDVLAAGVSETAATVHYVDEGIDTGAVIASERVPVLPGDDAATLRARVQAVEHRLLPRVVRELIRRVIARALLSCWDKTGLDVLATRAARARRRAVASGGTASFLDQAGIPVTFVETVTGFPELLGHRVVTLHPAIHGGILARRDVPQDDSRSSRSTASRRSTSSA